MSGKSLPAESSGTMVEAKVKRMSVAEKKKNLSPKYHFMVGGFSGALASTITFPLEVLRTRLQSSKVASFVPKTAGVVGGVSSTTPGTFRFLKHVLKQEGVAGWYRGIGTTLVGVMPSRGLYFGVYQTMKNSLGDRGIVGTPAHIAAAAVAGGATATFTNPLWVVKTRMQLQGKGVSAVQVFRDLVREDGYRGLFKGLTASYAGISETVLQFAIYEAFKKETAQYYKREWDKVTPPPPPPLRYADDADDAGLPISPAVSENITARAVDEDATITARPVEEDGESLVAVAAGSEEDLHPAAYIATASGAKIIASTLTYPHEVVRTRLREAGNTYKGFWDCLFTIKKREGLGVWYRGLGPHLQRVVPNTAIMFLAYELLSSSIAKSQE